MKLFSLKQSKPEHLSLLDVTPKITDNGYVFANVSEDLGAIVDNLAGDSFLFMSYAYARRAAAAALYLQGIFSASDFEHVTTTFKGIQCMTSGEFDFQEACAMQSIEFIQSYAPGLSGLFIKQMVFIADSCDIPGGVLSDEQLVTAVFRTIDT